jgi:hypothetical protein
MVTLAEAEQGEGLWGLHAERDGQQDRDGAGAAEPGDEAHHQAGDDADHEHEQEVGVGQRLERGQSGIEHRRSPSRS